VTVEVAGLDAGAYTLSHLRIDADHSNSHTAWVAQGSPQLPSDEQLAAIRARQGLEELEPARTVEAAGEAVTLQVSLPLPAVSLLVLEPVR
jgi:xylan 1,4-beta-xylosidase